MLRRRDLLVVLGTAALAPSSFAQQHAGKLPHIGWLVPTTQAEWDSLLEEYREGMRNLGYIEGRNIETEYLYADGHFERLPDLAAKLKMWTGRCARHGDRLTTGCGRRPTRASESAS